MERRKLNISRVPRNTRDQIKLIANNSNMNMSEFMRPKIREIINSFPEHLKICQNSENCHMEITGIPIDLVNDLSTIAKNLGVSNSDILCLHLDKIVNETPTNLKTKWD